MSTKDEIDGSDEGTEVQLGGDEEDAPDANDVPAEDAVVTSSDDDEEKEEVTSLVEEEKEDSSDELSKLKGSDSQEQKDVEQGANESTAPPSAPDPPASNDTPPETTGQAEAEASTADNPSKTEEGPSCLIIGVGAFLVAVILTLVVAIVVIARNGDSEKSSRSASTPTPSQSPITAPSISATVSPSTSPPTDAPTSEEPSTAPTGSFQWQLEDPRVEELIVIYEDMGLDVTAITTITTTSERTPQVKALAWILFDSSATVEDTRQTFVWDTLTLQRYALATFYYATNGVPTAYSFTAEPWTSDDLWLTSASICDWYGVSCNGQNEPIGLDLSQNGLTGSIPIELAFLGPHLQTLNLSSNFIHVSGDEFAVFEYLPQLTDLLLDDNFVQYNMGLPTSFAAMTSLEKLRLNYNLLSGGLPTNVLASLTQLTHLEIESNFMSGTLAPSLWNLSNLVYVYLRNNEFETTLDSFSFLPNIFSLWLDNNDIVGTIPPAFGALTTLASLSIANTRLGGTIPTELGLLVNLRRVWLYSNRLEGTIPQELSQLTQLEILELHDNDLVGVMPVEICSIVELSDYAFSSLTSDCVSEVVCSCCYTCY